MKLKLLSLFGVVLFFAACSKNDDTQPDNGNGNTQLKDSMYLTSLVGGRGDSIVFNYNTDKTLKRYASISFKEDGSFWGGYGYFFHYDNGRLKDYAITSSGLDLNAWLADTTGRPGYTVVVNTAGQPIRMVAANDPTVYDSLVYNSQGQLIERITMSTLKQTPYMKATLTYENNNVVKVLEEYISQSYSIDYTYKYDDKNNMYLGARSMPIVDWGLFYYLSANNPIEEIAISGPDTTTSTFHYTYNDKGFPASYQEIWTDKYGTNVSTETWNFRVNYLP